VAKRKLETISRKEFPIHKKSTQEKGDYKMDLIIKTVRVGLERTNCYIVSLKTGETIVIDPGDDADKILAEISKVNNLKFKYILLTHGHFDHVGAVDGIKKFYSDVQVLIHEADIPLLNEVPEQGVFVGRILHNVNSEVEALGNEEIIPFGTKEIQVLPTPGHTQGGVCFMIDKVLFTGDTLFYHTIGRTDLPLSSESDLRLSLDKLKYLPPETVIYPGHGRESSIREETLNNSYLR
jgi:hydroxyacylglutathione hydrolase